MEKELMDIDQWKNIKEVASGIFAEGSVITGPDIGSFFIPGLDIGSIGKLKIISTGFYPCATFYIIGYVDNSKDPKKYEDPAKNGPIYNTKTGRRFPDFRSGPESIKSNDKYIETNAHQIVYVITSQDPNLFSPAGNLRLFIIKPNSRVDVNLKGTEIFKNEGVIITLLQPKFKEKDGIILKYGTIKQDQSFRTVASLDAAMDFYTQVKDTSGVLIKGIVETAKKPYKDYKAADFVVSYFVVADAVIQAIAAFSGTMGYFIGKLPFLAFLGEFGYNWMQNLLHANMAYGVACACGQKPESDEDFKTDLYFLFGSDDDMAVTMANIAKAAGLATLPSFDHWLPQPGAILGEVLSKEWVYKKIGDTKAYKAVAKKVMETRVGKVLARELSGSITPQTLSKKVPYVSVAFGALCSKLDAIKFGRKAKYYYWAAAKMPIITQVSVNLSGLKRGQVKLGLGATQQFIAEVKGTKNPSQTVTWSVTGASSGTSISAKGLLTIGAKQKAGTLTVKAKSTVDTSKSGTASVTVPATPEPKPPKPASPRPTPPPPPKPTPTPTPAPTGGPAKWAAVSNSPFGTSSLRKVFGVAYGNNTWVAVRDSANMGYSTDGINWTRAADNPFGTNTSSNITSIAYGNGRFVAGGRSGKMAYCGW